MGGVVEDNSKDDSSVQRQALPATDGVAMNDTWEDDWRNRMQAAQAENVTDSVATSNIQKDLSSSKMHRSQENNATGGVVMPNAWRRNPSRENAGVPVGQVMGNVVRNNVFLAPNNIARRRCDQCDSYKVCNGRAWPGWPCFKCQREGRVCTYFLARANPWYTL